MEASRNGLWPLSPGGMASIKSPCLQDLLLCGLLFSLLYKQDKKLLPRPNHPKFLHSTGKLGKRHLKL